MKKITKDVCKEEVTDARKKELAIDGSLTIHDLQGKVVFEQEFIHVENNTNYKVNLVGINKDTYVLKLSATRVVSL